MGQITKVDEVIYQVMPQFQRIAQKRQLVRWEEESQYALQICKANSRLLECEPSTLQDAVINVAAVGLTLNPASGYAYLVPEYSKQVKRNVCQLRISFKGLIKLATDTGAISWVKAEVVKDQDTFEYRGPCNMPLHHMNPFAPRGETVGAYCVAKTKEGELLVDVVSRPELDHIKSCAKTAAVWDNWFDEMAKKAIIKRAAKQWPKNRETERLNEAIQVINDYEGNDFDELEKVEAIACYILDHLEKGDLWGAGEAWQEATDTQKRQLWVAKTKGGYFTQEQKTQIRQAAEEYVLSCMTPEEREEREREKAQALEYADNPDRLHSGTGER